MLKQTHIFKLLFKYIFIAIIIWPATSMALTPQEIYDKVANSVYLIKSSTVSGDSAFGSAVAVKDDVVATNCHVALHGTGILVIVNKEKIPGQLVYADRKHDMCLVKVPGAHFQPVMIRPSETTKIGEEVYAIGNPEGLERSISRGLISNRYMTNEGLILQTDAAISPGSSGGGLFDSNANLVGLTTAKTVKGEGIGFVISSELITAALLGEKNWQPEKIMQARGDPQEHAIAHYYGIDQVALVTKDKNCFLILQGRSSEHATMSLLLWDPKNPKAFLVFPSAVSLKEAGDALNEFSKLDNVQLEMTKDYLVFNTVMYPLVGKALKGQYPVLFAGVDIDPGNYLKGGQFLLVQLQDPHGERGYKTVRFGLNGVPEAMAAYDNGCR